LRFGAEIPLAGAGLAKTVAQMFRLDEDAACLRID